MQKIQTFSGKIDALGASANRVYSFGHTNTLPSYDSHTNLMNESIASFLKSCGVDAAYEIRADADPKNKWLWIEGVPFLLIKGSSSSGYLTLRYPSTGENIWSSGVNLFNSYNGEQYNFRLGFAGKAKHAWILRVGLYNSATFNGTYTLFFYHATDIVDGGEARVYGKFATSISNGCSMVMQAAKLSGAYVKTVDEFATEEAPLQFWGGLSTKFGEFAKGKFPLIPMTYGPFLLNGVYRYIGGMRLPQGAPATSDSQTEAQIGGRKFLVTSIENPSTSYYNTGMIETT